MINDLFFNCQKNYSKTTSLVTDASALSKKRLNKKKKALITEKEGIRILAFSTAKEYKLENLSLQLSGLSEFKLSNFGTEFGSKLIMLSYHIVDYEYMIAQRQF